MKYFLDLSAEMLIDIIQDQDLNVSNEDCVLESVIRWVKGESEPTPDYHQKINRQTKLIDLLKAVRLCLVRPAILSHVFKLELLKNNLVAKNLIFNATLYHTEDLRHGQWLSAAIYRNCSELDHYGVYTLNDEVVRGFCFSSQKWFTLKPKCPLRYQTQLCVFNNELFCSGLEAVDSETSRPYVYRDCGWTAIADIPGNRIISLSHEKFIYVVNLLNKHLYRVNPKSSTKNAEQYCTLENLENIKYAMSFQGKIIFFSTMINNDKDETAVHSFDVLSKKWIWLVNLDGPAENVISFCDDNRTYIVQNNGVLWTISTCESEAIKITNIHKLWKFNKTLSGGATYNGKLMILYTNTENAISDTMRSSIRGMFSQICYRSSTTTCSMLIPATLAKASFNSWTSE